MEVGHRFRVRTRNLHASIAGNKRGRLGTVRLFRNAALSVRISSVSVLVNLRLSPSPWE